MFWGRGIGSEFGLGDAGGYGFARAPESTTEVLRPTVWQSSGRSAIAAALSSSSLQHHRGRRNTFLLPSYLCESIIQPFRGVGLNVRFYPVSGDLTINLTALRDRVDENTLGVLLVRYFGFNSQPDLTSALHRLFPDLTIIDDRTHFLLSDLASGYSPEAEIAVYSVRKWGPFPDLGLVTSPPGFCEIEQLTGTARNRARHRFFLLRTLGILLRTAYFAVPVAGLRSISLRPFKWAERSLDKDIPNGPPSSLTKWLWQRWDWPSVWRRRRENYSVLLENWPDRIAQPLFTSLPPETCPLGFPIRTVARDRIRKRLIQAGIYPPVHWVRPIAVAADAFPASAELAQQELTLPIDQRYTSKDMRYLIRVLKAL